MEPRTAYLQVLPDEGTEAREREEDSRALIAGKESVLRSYFRGSAWAQARTELLRRQDEIKALVIRDFRMTPELLLKAQTVHEVIDQLLVDPVKFCTKKGL